MSLLQKIVVSFLSIFLIAAYILPVMAEVPNLINYQGQLLNGDGSLVNNGDYLMSFRVYDSEISDIPLWIEDQTVSVASGTYHVLLGSGTPTVGTLDASLFSTDIRWLEIAVAGEVLGPRQRITSVPYALKAGQADSVPDSGLTTVMIADGAVTSSKIDSDEITASHITIGAVGASEIADGSVSSDDIDFNYAASGSKGGPATDVDCSSCVSETELDFTPEFGDITAVYSGNGLSGGSFSGDVFLDVAGPLSLTISNDKYNAMHGTQTSAAGGYGVYGANTGSGTNFGYLGSIGYGVRGEHSSGNYGFLGSSSEGVRGHSYSGTGGLFSSYSGTGGYFSSNIGPAGVFYSSFGDGLIVSKGNVGIGTADPASALHIVGTGNMSELIISPDGDNGTSKLLMCQDPDCNNGSIWRYDGVYNSLYLYFKDSTGSGFDDDRDKIAFKVEHHGQNDARVGINLPKEHDIRNILEVGGKILAEEILVVANIADYVFNEDYHLMSLADVEKYIDENHHLPGISSEEDVSLFGGTVPLGASYTQLLEKIEELTLYAIEQNEKIEILQKQVVLIQQQVDRGQQ